MHNYLDKYFEIDDKKHHIIDQKSTAEIWEAAFSGHRIKG